MNTTQFFEFLQKWRSYNKYPPASGWPRSITLYKDVWEGIRKLYDYTKVNNLEYETSFFVADGDVFKTDPFKGDESSVRSSHSIRLRYEPQKNDYYEKQVLLDDKVVKKDRVKRSAIPKKPQVGYLFNVHSHPIHFNAQGQKTYGFFSDTDIASLLGSPAMISGLVTDEFWLVCKTEKAINRIGEVGVEMLQNVSNKAFEGEKYLEDVIKEEMSNWGLVIYRGKFGSSLIKVI